MFGPIGSGELAIYTAYVLTFLSTFIVCKKLLQEEEARAAQASLEDLRGRKSSNALVRMVRPVLSQYIVPIVRTKKYWDNYRKIYKRKIVSAGLSDELTPDEMLAFKLFLIVFFPILGGFMRAFDVMDLSMISIVLLMIAGWFYPDLWVSLRIKARHKKVLKSMPFIVDLLALSTEAGLDFIGAIGKVVEKASPGPFVDEFEQLLKEIKVGSSRADALREMALRINMPEVNSFVAILISADQMGAPIGRVLRQQSDQIRNQRFVMAEKAGALAQTKLLIPLMLFIIPAIFLMIGAPFLMQYLGGGMSAQ